MNHPVCRWLAAYRTPLLLAPPVFALLAGAAAIHARLTQQPLLPLITAWAEWFAALLLLPLLATMGSRLRRRESGEQRDRPALLSLGYVLALAVFLLDLVFRAAFGLGWDPYFGI